MITARCGNDRRSVRLTLVLLVGTALLPVRGTGQQMASSTRVIDVSGSPTRVLTLGIDSREQREAVLVLFGAAGAPIEAWGAWPERLATLRPVVAYDRPGIGGSPFDGQAPTPERVVEHAHQMLAVLNVPPPYVLVGWSWGGPLVRHYSGAYPSDVAGLVYLDPTDMEATPAEAAGASSSEELRDIYAELDAVVATRNTSPAQDAERRVITQFNRSSVAERGLPDDLAVPTVVVLATRVPDIPSGAPSYVTEAWYETMYSRRARQFSDWAERQPDASVVVAPEAGHAIHLEDPDLALGAVAEVLDRVSSGAGIERICWTETATRSIGRAVSVHDGMGASGRGL